MSVYMMIESELTKMMENLGHMCEDLGVEHIAIDKNTARIHGADDKGEYIMSSPEFGTAEGLLFKSARYYLEKEDEDE